MKGKILLFMNRVLPLLLLFKVLTISAQTNPTPHDLSLSGFSFTGLPLFSTTYPTSMQGWQTSANNIIAAEVAAPAGDYALSLGLPGIMNNTINGFLIQSSDSGASRRVGSIALSLNTTGRNNIVVNWTAEDITATTRRQTNLTLQYRIGDTGNFTTLPASTYSTISNNLRAPINYSITLPYACIDEPLVQLRWIYYESGSASTTRDPIRLDEISVTSSAMSCPQKPSDVVITSQSNTTAQISWTAASPVPASGYDYYFTTSATAPTDATVPSGNTSSTFVNLTGLLADTTYYFYVRSRCGGGSQQSKWVPIIVKTYCTPNFNNSDKGRLYINSFQFVGVLNNTVANTSTWASGYQNFTSFTPIAEQPQGTAINILASSGSTRIPRQNGTWKAWVDWNKDGDFTDGGEEVYNMISFTTPSVTFGFIIPIGQNVGTYTLRIGTFSSTGNNFSSCSTDSGFGEMEDYTFKVVADCSAKITGVNNVNLYDGERCGTGSVRLSATGNASAVNYRWYDSIYGGTLLGTGNVYNTPSISSTTTYYVTAVSSTGCETAFRYPVEARIDPNPTVTFNVDPEPICGEDKPSLLVSASGDKYQDVIFEKFDSGLGVFTNIISGPYTDPLAFWENRPSPYRPAMPPYEGLSPALSSGYFGEGFAMINTDINRNSTTKSILNRLVSNDLNVSGFLNLKVDFDLYNFSIASDFTEGYTLIEYSLDGGVNWNTLDQFVGTRGNPLKWDKFSYNIPGTNFTSTNFKLRFSVYSYSGPFSGGGNGFIEGITAIDNIKLSGFKTITTPFSWNSATVSLYDSDCTTTLSGSDLRSTVCVKPTATQLEDLNWTLDAGATFSNGCPAFGSVVVNNNTKTWKQPGITDWNLGAQWRPLNVPDINKCVIVRTPVEIPTNVSGSHGLAKSVIVKTGGTLTISPNSSLTIQNHLKNEAAVGDVIVENNANLIQNNNTASNSGSITVRRNANLKRLDYNYWGAPVSGQMLKAFSPNTLNNRFLTYNESDDFFYAVPSPSLTPFTPGIGYAIRADNTYTSVTQVFNGQFQGQTNNGIITATINCSTCSETSHGNNLISNPYPSNIDFDKLQANNPSLIYRTAYFWTNFNTNPIMQGSNYPGAGIINNYAVYNASGGVTAPYAGFSGLGDNNPRVLATPPNKFIKVGQGFIVKAKTAGTLSFDNSIRTNDNSAVFINRQANNNTIDRYWLSLKTPLDLYSPILVAYVNGASNNYEFDYDSELLTVASDSFYSNLNDKKLAIQGKSYPFVNNDVVSLGAKFYQAGNYTIGIDKKEGIFADGQEIYLRDNYLGVVANLSQSTYTFSTEAGEANNRFEILYNYRTLGVDATKDKNGITIYKEGNHYFVGSSETMKIIKVYDASGKLLEEKNINAKEYRLDITKYQSGVFILDIKTSTHHYNKKVMK